MPPRLVVPEILDHLPPGDPAAIRSRRDLRRINFLMGNERWILSRIHELRASAPKGITELGAGDGVLTRKLARKFPSSTITAVDLSPPPPQLPPNVDWHAGDLFSSLHTHTGGILVANLFLHHFEGGSLHQLGHLCRKFDTFIFNEPARGKIPHLLGNLLHPFINHVTRHDMHVSIDAGFHGDELPRLMELSALFEMRIVSSWRGGYRVIGFRV